MTPAAPSRRGRIAIAAIAAIAAPIGGGCQRGVAVVRESGEPCLELPAAAGAPPVIDGRLDPSLAAFPLTPVGWNATGMVPSEVQVSWVAAHRADGLYVFVDVIDPTRDPATNEDQLFCGDAVEIFVDADGTLAAAPAFDDPGAVQLIVAGPRAGEQRSTRAARYRTYARLGPWSSPQMGAFAREDGRGYVVEAFVTAADLDLPAWSLVEGARIGLDLSIDVGGSPEVINDYSCPGRRGQFSLRVRPEPPDGGCGLPYCDTAAFCTPTLVP